MNMLTSTFICLDSGVIFGGVCLSCLIIGLSLAVLIQNFNFKDVLRLLANGAGDDEIAGKKKKKKTKRGTLGKAPIKATQPIEEDESWESVFTIKHSPTQPLVVPIPRPSSKLKMINPCKCCHDFTAKKNCQYDYCAKCCRAKYDSVCHAHRTGFSHASNIINEAVKYGKYFEVDISYCNLTICPAGIGSLGIYIVTLNLSNNRLTAVPSEIGSLLSLEELFLQYNHITELPSSICQLKYLIELDVKNNCMTSVPEDIGSLSSLAVLCLINNQLQCLPHSIGRLNKLEELSIQSNLLSTLPDSICQLKNLKFLYAAENKLKSLPEKFGKLSKLEELDLSGCQLVMMPESFSYCKSLVRVWLSNNRLIKLPTFIGNLNNLKELHIQTNNIRVFPISIRSLNLYTFIAHNNPKLTEKEMNRLNYIPRASFPSLLELSARSIKFHQLTWIRGNLPEHLEDLLTHKCGTCTLCGGPFFTHYSCQVSYHLVGVFYRLPLYNHCCSPHNPSSCDNKRCQYY